MAQAIATPGNGLPHGAAVIQPSMAGQRAVLSVKIGSESPKDSYDPQLTEIAQRLGKLAQEQVTAKGPVETRWLEGIRAYHGIYESKLRDGWENAGQSTAYVKATRAKTVALEARLMDLIFPTDDKNWGIEPTPVPKLAAEKQEAELRANTAAMQANHAEASGDPAQAQQIVAAGNDEAQRVQAADDALATVSKASKAMQEEMDDQLIESHYPAESRLAIHDSCQLGTGILKGPIVNESLRGRWKPDPQSNVYSLTQSDDPRPKFRRVDPWNFFPDMSATRIDEAEFTFERYLWSASDLRKMVKNQGFDADAVRELIRDHNGRKIDTSASLANLVSLRSITGDSQGQIKGRFIGWEYHGSLECAEICLILNAMGETEAANRYADEDDPLNDHRVVIYFCDNVILKIADEYPLDSGETLYSVFNIEEAEGTIFGYGIPRIMADSQDALNSSWRMALDNGALSIGPQAMIDKTQIEPADGEWLFRPKKIWLRAKQALAGVTAKPIEFFNIPNNMEEIAKIIQLATVFIDMETGIPQPQQGEQGAHTTPTVGGMAILQNAANIIFRRVVKNYDDQMITPSMRRLYDWNMQFNPRDDIKGDMQIDARGTSVLLLKEVQATNLMLIVTQLMANPNIEIMLKPYPNVQKLFQAMMIKPADVMVTEAEYEKRLKDQAANPPPPSPAEIQAKSRVDAANIMADVGKGKNATDKEVALIHERVAMIELAAKGEISLKELQTELAGKQIDTASRERMQVTEAAIDKNNADAAIARGEVPGGSGGSFNDGPKP